MFAKNAITNTTITVHICRMMITDRDINVQAFKIKITHAKPYFQVHLPGGQWHFVGSFQLSLLPSVKE